MNQSMLTVVAFLACLYGMGASAALVQFGDFDREMDPIKRVVEVVRAGAFQVRDVVANVPTTPADILTADYPKQLMHILAMLRAIQYLDAEGAFYRAEGVARAKQDELDGFINFYRSLANEEALPLVGKIVDEAANTPDGIVKALVALADKVSMHARSAREVNAIMDGSLPFYPITLTGDARGGEGNRPQAKQFCLLVVKSWLQLARDNHGAGIQDSADYRAVERVASDRADQGEIENMLVRLAPSWRPDQQN